MSEITITEFARMGGNAKFKKFGAQGMKEMSKLGVEAKKKKREELQKSLK